jgi:hypothetical protein
MFRVTCGSLAITAMMLAAGVGCEKKTEPAKTNVPKPPAPDVTPKAMSGGVGGGGAPSVTTTPGGTHSVATTLPVATQPTVAAGPKPTFGTDGGAPLITSTDSAKKSRQAQDLIAKAMQSLKDNKFDACKADLDKVDAMGDAIPKATREQSKTVRESLNKAEQLQKVPELPTSDGPNK